MLDKEKVQEYLLKNGVNPDAKGFPYLVDAIADFNIDKVLLLDVYPQIAENHGISASKVQSRIRTALVFGGARDLAPKQFITLGFLTLEREMREGGNER